MIEVEKLLKKSGYSRRAIDYYMQKVNVGEINDPSIPFAYTCPCGDTMEILLKIDSGVIKRRNFKR